MANRPAAEIELTETLVRTVLRDQVPDLADEPLQVLARGWDNTNFRLGQDDLLRMPHRSVAADLILLEQRWLPSLAQGIDLTLPVPTHHGVATSEYPWPWSVVPWIPGTEAASASLADPATTAETLGRFYAQLHLPAPSDAPINPYRGCPLHHRSESFATNLAAVSDDYDRDAMRAIFDQACAITPSSDPVWLHGDAHTRNMVVCDGELSAVIDWGDVCVGDRATDLSGAFMLVPEHLDIVAKHATASDDDWKRARGWAINFAAIYLARSDDDPVMRRMGTRLLATLLAS